MLFQTELDLLCEGRQRAALYGIGVIGPADVQTDRVRFELRQNWTCFLHDLVGGCKDPVIRTWIVSFRQEADIGFDIEKLGTFGKCF